MKKRIVIALVVVAAAVLVVVATGASGGGGGTYTVRAIFDNADFIVPGEQVKISGVPVGKVTALSVTPDKKAAISFQITDPKFADFRRDAHCTIRPESLIGERFVECSPTVPNDTGRPKPPPLKRIPSGQDGAGEYLLPVTQTSTPVDVDLIADTMRLPYRQRLSLIINELGTGLAANGDELRDVIRRADPTLADLDKVLAILASENRTLAQIQHDSNIVLSPLARDRTRVADFIVRAAQVAQATAERRGDLERNLQLLPTFLAELRRTTPRINGLADQAVPVLQDLHAHAPAINHLIQTVGPFAKAARPATKALGHAAKIGGPALVKALPVARQISNLAVALRPVAADAADLLTSLQKTGGIERAMDYIFYQTTAINGEDKVGHYLRAGLITNINIAGCSTYNFGSGPRGSIAQPAPGCSANFSPSTASTSASVRAAPSGAGAKNVSPEISAAQQILSASARRMRAGKKPLTAKQGAEIYARDAKASGQSGSGGSSDSTTSLLQYLTGSSK